MKQVGRPAIISKTTAIIAAIAVIVPLLVLVGWDINNELLKRIYPGLTSMNPTTAVCFILLGASIFITNLRAVPRRLRLVAHGLQVLVALVGLIVVARFALHLDIPIDRWLFYDRLDTPGYPPSKIAPNAALNFTLVAVALLWSAGTKTRKQFIPQFLLGVAASTTVVALFGYAYGFTKLYRIGTFVPMALHTAVLFLLVIVAVFALHPEWRVTRLFQRLNSMVWIGLVVVALALLLTGVAWRQNDAKIKQHQDAQFNQELTLASNEIEQRLNSYVNILDGFRAFYSASDTVTRGDFHNYYTSLDLANNYPGVRAMSLVRDVPAAQADVFVRQVRTDTTLPAASQPNFTITPAGARSEYYVATFVEPTSRSFGFDLGTDTTRLDNLLKAKRTATVSASATVDFNARFKDMPKLYGLFMSVPLYEQANGRLSTTKTDKTYGFINASFEYQKLFDNLLGSFRNKGLTVELYDKASGTPLYQQLAPGSDQTVLSAERTVRAANRQWRLRLTAPPSYAISQNGSDASRTILVGGALVAGLLLLLFWNVSRSRQHAVRLAMHMTQDLHTERDAAIAVQKKDEAILSSIGDAVFAIDTNHRIVLFNPVAARISGYSQDEAMGEHYSNILKFVHDDKPNSSFIARAMQGHLTAMKEHTVLKRKDGTLVPVADSAAPIHDAKGKITGVIVVFRDVTHEQQLDKAKTEFVSLASHQLRTPLAAVNWYAELLLSGDIGKLTKTQREYVQEMFEGNQRMIELVNALLDASRLDLGKFSNVPQAVSLKELSDSLAKELTASIALKNLVYRAEVTATTPPLQADPKLVRMILQNLLSNAVKYTPQRGTVTLRIRPATAKDASRHKLGVGSYVIIDVGDTGYGIPTAQQDKIFGKMFRADNVQQLDEEGTGLGLYIVKQVVERLGGRISFVSVEGHGSTFTVLLPEITKPS